MDGRAFVVASEVFHPRNGNILTLQDWFNNEKQFCLCDFNYINLYLYLWRALITQRWDLVTYAVFFHQMCIGG